MSTVVSHSQWTPDAGMFFVGEPMMVMVMVVVVVAIWWW
jgi:hypothetical protein